MFVRIFILVAVAVLVWSATAHSSQAHGRKQVVTVKPYDTLWSIAQRHYGGDVRDAIWRIERANHLPSANVRVGQTLVLP
jgi:nucleoid-associated protein YgaU